MFTENGDGRMCSYRVRTLIYSTEPDSLTIGKS